MLLLALVPGAAAASGFSFRAIEFEPDAARLPAAQAFVARVAAPGTPIATAVAAIQHAEAACGRPRRGDAAIVCRSSRPVQRSDLSDELGDVVWTVTVRAAPDGTVAAAAVTRDRYGP